MITQKLSSSASQNRSPIYFAIFLVSSLCSFRSLYVPNYELVIRNSICGKGTGNYCLSLSRIALGPSRHPISCISGKLFMQGALGCVVVKALSYKPEGRGFDTR
jgi:hypothetical protein